MSDVPEDILSRFRAARARELVLLKAATSLRNALHTTLAQQVMRHPELTQSPGTVEGILMGLIGESLAIQEKSGFRIPEDIGPMTAYNVVRSILFWREHLANVTPAEAAAAHEQFMIEYLETITGFKDR